MANLIPPDAKKEMRTEYWFRVITVLFVGIGCAFLVTTVLMFPSYILIKKQLDTYSLAYNNAKSKHISFTTAENTIVKANKLATLLATQATTTNFTTMIDTLDNISGNDVDILNFRFQKEKNIFSGVQVGGIAKTRNAFAQFSKNVEANPLFSKAELPISSLAKDKDINFDIKITPTQK